MSHLESGSSVSPRISADLSDEERETYAWQLDVRDFGEVGQRKLKGASVLVSRVGGLGSAVAYELAAAGIGRLILAHAGNVRPSDLNRQLLMTHDWLGKPRIESAVRRLKELNPRLEIVGVGENLSPSNADRLVGMADCVVDAAPMFQERLAMNDAAQRQGKPVIEAAMFELEASLTVIHPPETASFREWVPEVPAGWKRRFPVVGAVSGTVGCLAAMEAIKLIVGLGKPLKNRLLRIDLRSMRFDTIRLR
ncbi:MAG: HesA/MoeB/ThiF family protein [Planctomycetaceae bacterium]|nr:MAG: HesA/MoeB/ThiF family protein [Planctomycetaceae bacterium]